MNKTIPGKLPGTFIFLRLVAGSVRSDPLLRLHLVRELSRELAEVAKSVGVPAVLIDGIEDIPWGELTPDSAVLLTSGASAPDIIVQTCAQFLNDV